MYATVVCCVHACRDRYEGVFAQAKATDHIHASEAALATSVCHGGKLHGFRLVSDRFVSEGNVVIGVDGGFEGDEWLSS